MVRGVERVALWRSLPSGIVAPATNGLRQRPESNGKVLFECVQLSREALGLPDSDLSFED